MFALQDNTFSISDVPIVLDNAIGPDDVWCVAPFDYQTPGDAVVAVSIDGRELTAGEVREALSRKAARDKRW